jgi:hypothetical protein
MSLISLKKLTHWGIVVEMRLALTPGFPLEMLAGTFKKIPGLLLPETNSIGISEESILAAV